MGVGFRLVGQADSSGIETPEKFVQRIAKWSRRATGLFGYIADVEEYPEAAHPTVTLQFFPAAEPVEFTLEQPGIIVVSANCTSMGPGYHQWLCDDMLDKFAKSLGVTWFDDDGDACHDETGYFYRRNRAELEQSYLSWLGAVSEQIKQMSAQDYGDIMLAMPASPLFVDCGYVVTPMGPRDYLWVERVSDNPASGRDFFVWWDEGETPQTTLNAAVCLMWTEVRWREPKTESERRTFSRLGLLLRKLMSHSGDLIIPWREWQEILPWTETKLSEGKTDTFLRQQHSEEVMFVLANVDLDDPDRPLIGYRRQGKTCTHFDDGWQITVPGSFSEEVQDDGTWVAWEFRRTVRLTRLNVVAKGGTPPPREEMLERAREREAEDALDRIDDGDGLATIRPYEEEGEPLLCLNGYSAVDGSLAILSVYFADTRDRDWAVEVWRSVRNPQQS